MQYIKFLFLGTAVFAAGILPAASVWYVDNGHLSASDANPGTESAPLKTIQKAADQGGADLLFYQRGNILPAGIPPSPGVYLIRNRAGNISTRVIFALP